MHKTSFFGLSVLAVAASGWIAAASAQAPAPPDAAPPAPAADASAPAPAPEAKPVKHKSTKHKETVHRGKNGKLIGSKEGDAAVEDLNTKSLAAAKSGTAFTPGK